MFVSLHVQTASAGTAGMVMLGGILEGSRNAPWCCSMFADVCGPCDNPANQFEYRSPSPCSSPVAYQDLTVRCMDPTCNNLTKGGYNISLCSQNSTGFSTTSFCSSPCQINSSVNTCRSTFSNNASNREPVWVHIEPTNKPNASFDGLWTALARNCNNS